MRVGDAESVAEAAGVALEAWAEYLEKARELRAVLAHSTGELGNWHNRVEAYDALVGRDEGGGDSLEGWLRSIKEAAVAEAPLSD